MYSGRSGGAAGGGGGGGDDSESDSWNDFSLADSDKELSPKHGGSARHQPHPHQSGKQDGPHAHSQRQPQRRTSVSSSGHVTPPPASHASSPHPASNAAAASSATNRPQLATPNNMRYPAAADLRGDTVATGRQLPSKPEHHAAAASGGPGGNPHTPISGPPAQHGQGEDYEPSFHRETQATTRAIRNLTTKPAVKVGNHGDQQQLQESGDPPHSFAQPGGASSRHGRSPTLQAKRPSGRSYKAADISASSLEPVSSQIFDDEEGEGRRSRQNSWRANMAGRTERSGSHTAHSPLPMDEEGDPKAGVGLTFSVSDHGRALEEQALINIHPDRSSVAWTASSRKTGRRERSSSHRFNQSAGPSSSKNAADGPAASRAARGGEAVSDRPPRDSNLFQYSNMPSVPDEEATADDVYASTQFLYHHVTEGLRPPHKPEPEPYMLGIARRSERIFTRVWGELFAALSIPLLFVTTLVAHLVQFTLARLVKRPLLLVQVVGDYLLKPLLVAVHNSLIQPLLVLGGNILVNVFQMLSPAVDFAGRFTQLAAELLQSFRLFEIHHHHHHGGGPGPGTVSVATRAGGGGLAQPQATTTSPVQAI